MNEQRLAQLLRDADTVGPSISHRDATALAMSARSIRRERQQHARLAITASLVLMIGIGSIAMIGWRNLERDRTGKRNDAIAALRNETDRLDGEAADRMQVVQAVARSTKPAAKVKAKTKPQRDISFELDQERERAA